MFCHRIYIELINYIEKMNIKHIKKKNYYILKNKQIKYQQ